MRHIKTPILKPRTAKIDGFDNQEGYFPAHLESILLESLL